MAVCSSEADAVEPLSSPQSPPGDGDGGWVVSDGLAADTAAVAMPPPPRECEEDGEEMGMLHVSRLPQPHEAREGEVEEERMPRGSSDPSEERHRSLSAVDAPIPVASVRDAAPPDARRPIRKGSRGRASRRSRASCI